MTDDRALGKLTAEDFRGRRGTRFRLTGSGTPASFEVELADVAESASSAAGALRAPFSVLFHGPLELVLPQGIYRLEHELFKVPGLFIVPVGPAEPAEPGQAATAMRYQAVFG